MRIGIDIGGTHTDAVLVDQNKKIVACIKVMTTRAIDEGVQLAVTELLQKGQVMAHAIVGIYIGSTHATNAILEGKDLLRVGLVRLAGHTPDLLPGFAWPKELRSKVISGFKTVSGGYECDGSAISTFHEQEVRDAVNELLESGAKAISVVGVFSPINGDQEHHAAEIVREIAGTNVPVTISSDIGGIGYIERENATIMNSALKKVVRTGFESLELRLRQLGLHAPVYMIHNDGSLLNMKQAIDYPIFTISAGQTNSFRGAACLAGVENAVVIDIGGTSSDIGIVENGYAKRSLRAATIGGVKLHFAMPDVLSLAIGGGTIVSGTTFGPESVAKNLFFEAQCFGGNVLTTTDMAVQLGIMDIKQANPERVRCCPNSSFQVLKKINQRLLEAVQMVKGKKSNMALLVVGGASALFQGADSMEYGDVANAFGAQLAQVSSTVDVVTSLHKRELILDELKERAIQRAIDSGACQSKARIVNMEIIPYAYSKDNLCRVIVTAAG